MRIYNETENLKRRMVEVEGAVYGHRGQATGLQPFAAHQKQAP